MRLPTDQTRLEPTPRGSADREAASRTNWAGNVVFRAAATAAPDSVQALRDLVLEGSPLKALGSGHSFNRIADSPGRQVSLQHFKAMRLDQNAHTVTVGGGVTYGRLAPWLDAQGFAVHNLASLPHITVVGACATATHGSGLGNKCLSAAVSALSFVNGRGDEITLSRGGDPDVFEGGVVSMGALGIVHEITLDIEPRFDVAQAVYEGLPFAVLEQNLDAICGEGYSVSLFTDWQRSRFTQVWVKRRVGSDAPLEFPPTLYGATLQTEPLHPLPGHGAENCTPQLGVAGPWYERLPHFRMEFTPSSGAEIQTEYFVRREDASRAVAALDEIADRIAPHLFISELRTVKADSLWLSMAYGRDSLAIHFTWKPREAELLRLLPEIEQRLAPFRARPHWAKMHTMEPAAVEKLYPRFHDFEALRQRHDPQALFSRPTLL